MPEMSRRDGTNEHDRDDDDDGLDDATRQVMELLSPMGPISARRLFGTWGLYLEDHIFGLMHDGIVYFRTSAETVARYVASGSQPFLYRRSDGRSTVMQYHEVPHYVLQDADLACAWAFDAAASTT
jgi:DNA transformation protein